MESTEDERAPAAATASDGAAAVPLPAGLAALIGRAGPSLSRPVESWDPPMCGDLDIRIHADGGWSYLGSPIGREAIVRLFASVLRRDADGRHYLVTPVEKVGITVDDVAFQAVEMHAESGTEGLRLVFRTNVGDIVEAGPDHPMRFVEDAMGGFVPYLHVRGRLEARATRAVAQEIAALLEPGVVASRRWWLLKAGGTVFPVLPEDAEGAAG
jgi:hypothetical protein